MLDDNVKQFQPKPDDFVADREFWLSRIWNNTASIDYAILKTKQILDIL